MLSLVRRVTGLRKQRHSVSSNCKEAIDSCAEQPWISFLTFWSQNRNNGLRLHHPCSTGASALEGVGGSFNLTHLHHSRAHQMLQLGRGSRQLGFPERNPAAKDHADMYLTVAVRIRNQHHHHMPAPGHRAKHDKTDWASAKSQK